MKTSVLRFSVLSLAILTCVRAWATDQPVEFATDVAPIFAEHCLRCHSAGNAKGDISLATFEDLKENEYVIPGDPDGSHLLQLVAAVDGTPPEMPKESDPLSDEEVGILRRWISQGAKWPQEVVVRELSKADATWWAYQPLKTPRRSDSSPDATGSESPATTIDDFIRAKLAERNLKLNPLADRRTLIRRATYDLTGLPPTPEAVEAFFKDQDPQAYEKLIDGLLASPHYGERWGRHWLDVVRFGESNGFERNVIINDLWPFRDYVIRSINENKPFDQFIREHIAGDVLGKGDPKIAVGTAFLVAGPYDDVNNQDAAQAAQIRANTLDEIINATGQAFLGMTLGCARCHEHKFDPISQADYYGLYATFAGIRHSSVPLSTREARVERAAKLKPLNERKAALEKALSELNANLLQRAKENQPKYAARWTRDPVDRIGTEDRFEPVVAKFVRLVCEAQDINPAAATGFRIDEFEVWSAAPRLSGPSDERPDSESKATNVALRRNGGKATGNARQIEDFPDAYGAHHAIDGKTGARFIATGTDLTVELVKPILIDRVVFSSARGETTPEHHKFVFVAEYRIEASEDGEHWQTVASSRDRKPIPQPAFVNHRLLQLETTEEDRAEKARLAKQLAVVNREIAKVPPLPSVWIGRRVEADAQGPFHVFLGGNPQKKGVEVVPASLSVLGSFETRLSESSSQQTPDSTGQILSSPDLLGLPFLDEFRYRLARDAPESQRRKALAGWLVHPSNPVTPRVLANRLWHYHFGTGIVDTPNDFGYMGGRPTHPELLDFLAVKLKESGWRIKALHRLIMMSQAYRQSSAFREDGAMVDGDTRLLWRFPPRRLSAEEIRDTILMVAGKLNVASASSRPDQADQRRQEATATKTFVPDGGPGFRLYHFMQDNVSTYVPLDKHGPETYRRAVYHQNARASVVDLMTEFDQPDCTFSAPKRAETTTPLQALTMLNHSFTLDMAQALAKRLQDEAGDDPEAKIRRAYQLCYARQPTAEEAASCRQQVDDYGLAALCRVLLNTSELIYVQ